MYKKSELDNGLKLIANEMPGRQSLSLGIWINAGGRYDTFKNKGISHYLEHMLFKGTKKYSCNEIKESIEGIGGSLNGFTSEELTCYLVKIPSRYLEPALDILSDMVLDPALRKEEVKKERTVILEEIKMYKDQPQSLIYDLLDELLWPDQPLGAPIIGTFDSVSGISDKNLFQFKQSNYTPANIVVSAAGALDFGLLVELVTKKFSRHKGGDKNAFLRIKERQESPKLKILNKGTEQTHLALGFNSFKRDHPLRHALGLLHIILGGNMSSRLFNELREKRGLAYEIGTIIKRFQDTGAFMVHAGIDNRKVPEAIRLILSELNKCIDKPVSKDEFKRAKEFYLGQLMLALEDTLEYMLWIGEYTATLDKTYSIEEIIKQVNKVAIEDLRDAAKQVFRESKLNLALIGPLKNSHAGIQAQLKLSGN